ncbi:MAG: ABC transporter permease, partial [Bacteroidales bacterium]
MIKSYLISAVRNFRRQKLSTVINILGLSTGLCCAFLIALYAIDEFSYDRFHEDAANIYRFKSKFGIQTEAVPLGPYLLNDYLISDIPEIQSTVRLRPERGEDFWIRYNDQNFIERSFILADSNFFSFFSFPLLQGQPGEVLRDPNSVVISQSAALRYFGDTDPVGEILHVYGQHPTMVTGIMHDFPSNSHFNASMIANFELARNYLPSNIFDNWGSLSCHYYIKLEDHANSNVVSYKIMQVLEEIIPHMTELLTIYIQPLLDVRLHSANVAWDISNQGSITILHSLIAIALVIILLASVNYINLYTAQSTKRKKEVGIRKVLGARKSNIFWQSMSESFISVIISFIIALGITEILLPYANELSGKTLTLVSLFTPPFIFWLLAFPVFIAFLSGFYPAMVAGSFTPAHIFRGSSPSSLKSSFWGRILNLRIRQVLIIFQFVCAIVLITLSLSINRQINYLFTKDYGYEAAGLIVISNPDDDNRYMRFSGLKNHLETYQEVELVAAGENIPSNRLGNFTYISLTENDHEVQTGNLNVSHDYLEVLGAKLISGRLFNREYGTERSNIIINRTTANNLGYTPEDVVDKTVMSHNSNQPLRIIGVIEDIHFFSLHEPSPPIMFHLFEQPSPYSNILVRVDPAGIKPALDLVEKFWKQEYAQYPLVYHILEDRHKGLYYREEQTRELIIVFMIAAIIISLLGLFALA